MQRIYKPSAYDGTDIANSYWATTVPAEARTYPDVSADTTTEVAIIGGGFTGLSCALHLARDFGIECTVLEAGPIGWGASGRNGGFACVGGAKAPTTQLIRSFGEPAVKEFFVAQQNSIQLVHDILETNKIEADRHSDGELVLAHKPSAMNDLRAEADVFEHFLGLPSTVLPVEALEEAGMQGTGFHGGVITPIGFALNPMKYVSGLAQAAQRNKADLRSNSPVQSVSRLPDGGFALRVNGHRVRAKKLVVATNGYSSEDVPSGLGGRYLPVLSNIGVTRPLTPSELADQGWTTDMMASDSRNLLHYFRLMPNRRFLFGMRGGTQVSPATLRKMKQDLRADFDRMFPAWSTVEFSNFWAGLVCMTRNLTPFVGELPDLPGAYASLGYHGNGVAMSTYSGKLTAGLVSGHRQNEHVPAILQAPLRKFPISALRRRYLAPLYAALALID